MRNAMWLLAVCLMAPAATRLYAGAPSCDARSPPVRIVATVHLDTKPSRWDATNWLPTAKHCVDGLVWSAKHGGADVLADDSNAYVLGPDMRAGEQWADAALVLTIETREVAA